MSLLKFIQLTKDTFNRPIQEPIGDGLLANISTCTTTSFSVLVL